MENASKALLIAGAILIAVLLIGVAMLVMNGGDAVVQSGIGKMTEQEKRIFNEPFTRYQGERVSGSNVRGLIDNIISNNSTNKDIEGKIVSIEVDSEEVEASSTDLKSNEMSLAKNKINTGATYSVVINYNDDTGLVEKVIITNTKNTKNTKK